MKLDLTLKTIEGIKYFLYGSFIYLEIDMSIYTILVVLMTFDTLFGMIKVLRVNHKEFSFKRLLIGLTSKFGILLIPILIALAMKSMGEDMIFGVNLIVRILIVSELISCVTNIYTVKTGIIVKDIDIFTMLIKFIRNTGFAFIKTSLGIKDPDEPKNDKL